MWLALGLPAHVLVKALSPAFFAREDTLTPLMATLKGIGGRDRAVAFVLGHLFGAERHRRRHRARGMEQRVRLDPRGSPRPSDFPSMPRRAGGCRASSRPRWRWAALLWLARGVRAAAGHERAWPGAGRCSWSLLIAGGIAIYGLLLGLFGVTGWREAVSAIRQTGPPTCATRPAWQWTAQRLLAMTTRRH